MSQSDRQTSVGTEEKVNVVETTWQGLRRRKVVQWGIAYAAAAWTLLQVIEYLGETYTWPPAVRQIATPALALGLPLVLVLAWYHGDKGEQQVSRSEVALLSALIALAGGTLWWYASRLQDSAWVVESAAPEIKRAVPTGAPSVAVLPFVNMSSDPEQEYFSDGLSEEILNALAHIPRLYVPARTSSFQFKNRSGDVADIAARLGVATVLEGSVRKSGSRVRITAQLINAADGYHLWSETYDRELSDIFAIQSEIADAIADALRIQLTAEQKLAARQAPLTENTDAYEAYLVGRHELSKGQREATARAAEYFRSAVALDPKFAVAYAALAVAIAQATVSMTGMKWTTARQETLDRARGALDKARSLAPESAEVLAACGFLERLQSTRSRDEHALEYFERSLAVNPSSGQVLTWRNQELRRLGRFDQMLAASADALKHDPLSLEALSFRIDVLLDLGRRSEVEPLVERVRSLDEAQGQAWLATIADQDGDRPAAIRYCIASVRAGGDPRCGAGVFAALGLREEVFPRVRNPTIAHRLLGENREAVRLARAAYRDDPLYWEWDLVYYYWITRDFRSSWDFSVRARGSDEQGAGYRPLGRNPAILLAAADSARRLGEAQDAQALHDIAAKIVEGKVRAAAPFKPYDDFDQAMLAAYEGRDEDAARFLISDIRTMWSWSDDLAAPLFDEIRKRPDFQAAMREQRAVHERQRAEVVAILCGANPPPEEYKPAPETCARMKQPG